MGKSFKKNGIVKSERKHTLIESSFAIQIIVPLDMCNSHFRERQEQD